MLYGRQGPWGELAWGSSPLQSDVVTWLFLRSFRAKLCLMRVDSTPIYVVFFSFFKVFSILFLYIQGILRSTLP